MRGRQVRLALSQWLASVQAAPHVSAQGPEARFATQVPPRSQNDPSSQSEKQASRLEYTVRGWYGRCWWDPAAQDVLLGQLPLPIRRTRYWMAEAAARPDGGRP
jgi:hypothetical protein